MLSQTNSLTSALLHEKRKQTVSQVGIEHGQSLSEILVDGSLAKQKVDAHVWENIGQGIALVVL